MNIQRWIAQLRDTESLHACTLGLLYGYENAEKQSRVQYILTTPRVRQEAGILTILAETVGGLEERPAAKVWQQLPANVRMEATLTVSQAIAFYSQNKHR